MCNPCKAAVTSMRSLIITRWSPDRSDGGGALRNLQNLRALSALGQVDVLSIGDPDEVVRPVEGVADWVHFPKPELPRIRVPGMWFLNPRQHPLTNSYLHKDALAYIAALKRGTYDVALIEEICLAGYMKPLRTAGILTVFDAHNVEARLREDVDQIRTTANLRYNLRKPFLNARLEKVEGRVVREADLVWACSAFDADLLREAYRPNTPVAVVPNTVNIAAMSEAYATQEKRHSRNRNPALIYIGTYAYPPNVVAAMRLATGILPALRARGTTLKVVLVGRGAKEEMYKAAEADTDVTVTGSVDSVVPYLSQPCIVVLPITLGSGTRLKILEAFAAGCPVISTPKGAEGIDIRDGEDILIAKSDADFVTAIEWLAKDPQARWRIGEAGYKTASRLYSWEAATQAINDSLARIGLPK
jgi:glycosyltransferase involved in cell wall biosynthesis